jgi:hypothetical protein
MLPATDKAVSGSSILLRLGYRGAAQLYTSRNMNTEARLKDLTLVVKIGACC